MNQVLIILLFGVALFCISMSVIMSTKFRNAIVGLCRYADLIGNGKFNERVNKFKYAEFERLSTSMAKMSNMLQNYENNQKQFFQNASHELRTPLMSIQGYAEGIIEDVFTKNEAAEVIIAESARMEALVSGILYISRMDADLETSDRIYFTDVKNLLYDCHERLNVIAEKYNKRIIVEHPEREVLFKTDDKKLDVVIANILSNAIRHAESEIKISYCLIENNLEIQIQDDGQGIRQADLPHLFDRFFKGENGKTGLGLAIGKEIVESLGGNIFVENLPYPQSGAKFTVVLKNKK
jgi:signal transduction histidine kinase